MNSADLINSFAEHPSNELKQREVTVLQVGRGRWIQLLLICHLTASAAAVSWGSSLHGQKNAKKTDIKKGGKLCHGSLLFTR